MSTVKSKKLQVGTDATSSNNFTIYQPSTPDGTLRIGVGNADSPTEVAKFNSDGMVDTNLPILMVKLSSAQTVSSSTWTKIQFDTVEIDNKNWYDNTTNYRYTPQIAGYYQVHFGMYANASASLSKATVAVRKNDDENLGMRGTYAQSGTANGMTTSGSGIIYCNGSTDYLEVFGYITGTSPSFSTNIATSLQLSLLKQA